MGATAAAWDDFEQRLWEGNSLKRVSPHAPFQKLLDRQGSAGRTGTAAQKSLERGPGESLSTERFPPAIGPGFLITPVIK